MNTTIRIGFGSSAAALIALAVFASPAQAVEVHSDIAYKSGSSLTDYERERCRLDLYLPEAEGGFPVVVWFHGGGLTRGNKAREDHVQIATSLAERGVAVVAVNYRLSPDATFPAYVDDAAASVAWTLEHIGEYGGDDAGVFVSGHSAGGYLAAMVGVDPAYLRAYGHETSELAGMMPISGQMVTHATIRGERSLPEWRPIVDSAAPVFNVTEDAPPFLAIAGSHDNPARSEENRYFIAALKAVGHRDAAFIEFRGRDHGTIVSHIPEADDPVAAALMDFIERLSP